MGTVRRSSGETSQTSTTTEFLPKLVSQFAKATQLVEFDNRRCNRPAADRIIAGVAGISRYRVLRDLGTQNNEDRGCSASRRQRRRQALQASFPEPQAQNNKPHIPAVRIAPDTLGWCVIEPRMDDLRSQLDSYVAPQGPRGPVATTLARLRFASPRLGRPPAWSRGLANCLALGGLMAACLLAGCQRASTPDTADTAATKPATPAASHRALNANQVTTGKAAPDKRPNAPAAEPNIPPHKLAAGTAVRDPMSSDARRGAATEPWAANAKTAAPAVTPAADSLPQVVLETSVGELVIELDAVHAPHTVRNFLSYVDRHAYDGSVFHQVVAGYMILGGGFDEQLRALPADSAIANEAAAGLSNRRGTIAMARELADRDSATRQFFFNVGDNIMLDHRGPAPSDYGYCVFGRVVRGLDVLDRIAAAPVHDTPRFEMIPRQSVVIERAYRVDQARLATGARAAGGASL